MWKKRLFKKFDYKSVGLPCFYCNADSDELKYFLLLFIGGLSVGALLLGIGLILRGTFRMSEELADRPLQLHQKESVQNEENAANAKERTK